MKKRELFSPIPKEIYRSDDVREKVEIFLVLFVTIGLVYKFVTGCIDNFLSLDDHNLALVIFFQCRNCRCLPACLFAGVLGVQAGVEFHIR